MYVPDLHLSQFQIQRHSSLIPHFLEAAECLYQSRTIDPVSYSVIKNSHLSVIVPITLLSAFKLRFSELMVLQYSQLTKFNKIRLYQPKVRRHKTLDNSAFFRILPPDDSRIEPLLCAVRYETLSAHIARSLRFLNVPIVGDFNHHTHIFRHLWATWSQLQGVNQVLISSILGHRTVGVLPQYFHAEFVDLFNNFK